MIRKSELNGNSELETWPGIVSHSSEMKTLVHLARRVANVDATVLITGESGVGKERIAAMLHAASMRSDRSFVSVNCAAISETLLESELFGHERGAFTGAVASRPGLFEAADRGTILLDEIGEISPGMQVKLLRVLQEKEVRRIGENKTRPIDVRIVAATNRDLAAAVAKSLFREDLYYRLNVVELHVPPLRQRTDDILPLAHLFLMAASKRNNREITGFHQEAVRLLLRYQWPGNVRELENTMERAALFSGQKSVTAADLPAAIQENSKSGTSLYGDTATSISVGVKVETLEEVERNHIEAVLSANNGNQTRTAEQLGIGTATLYRKLRKYSCLSEG